MRADALVSVVTAMTVRLDWWRPLFLPSSAVHFANILDVRQLSLLTCDLGAVFELIGATSACAVCCTARRYHLYSLITASSSSHLYYLLYAILD